MKIYAPEPADLIRLQIVQQLQPTEYITLCETNRAQVTKLISRILEDKKLSPFIKGSRTAIHIREAKGAKNGKSKSVSFYGIQPSEMKKLIISYIENKRH